MNATGPLAGIKIVDLSIAATGPYAVALLADQGAEVVKVERPVMGDIGRWVGVSNGGMSALYVACNRGKRSIVIDIHQTAGADLVKRLAGDADVLVQNFRPGVMERVGLAYDDLAAVNPDLVYVSISGFGPVGPYASKSAYDTVIQAYAGLATNQADPNDDSHTPVFLRQTAADKITALTACQAITAALLGRERGHGGQHVELSMLDAVVSFLWADAAGNEVLLDADGSYPSSFVQGSRPMRFTDGWGIATPTSDADFAGICRGLGVDGYDAPEVATITARMTHRAETSAVMERVYEAASKLSTREAMDRLEAQRVPCGVVLSPAQLADDEHAIAVRLFEESDHPVAGRVRLPRHPVRFAGTPSELGSPAPALGQHTDEVLGELGLSGDEVAALRSSGVVA